MKHIYQALLIIALSAGVAAGGLGFWYFQSLNTPVSHDVSTEIEIPAGFSPDQVIARLSEYGIIKDPLPLRIYLKLSGAAPQIKAGSYKFASPVTPLQVLKRLQEGGEALARVTVVEGWNRWDIAATLARTPKLNIKDSAAALSLLDDPHLIKDLDPEAPNLEGYLFPDTYFIDARTTPQTLVSQMVSRFKHVWESTLREPARSKRLTVRQVVTIASLIETEAKLSQERAIVSSVIYNRLKRGIPLAIDSTIVYASKMAGKWRYDGKVYQSDIDRKSPYNTRRVVGLPPGPIGSPGLPSLEAALNPANTNYIFYVRDPARDDGAHNFYSDPNEFEKGVQALREWERQRDLREAAKQRLANPAAPVPATAPPGRVKTAPSPAKPSPRAQPVSPTSPRRSAPQRKQTGKRTPAVRSSPKPASTNRNKAGKSKR